MNINIKIKPSSKDHYGVNRKWYAKVSMLVEFCSKLSKIRERYNIKIID